MIADDSTSDCTDSDESHHTGASVDAIEAGDLEEDLKSRVQMMLDLVPTLEMSWEHTQRMQGKSTLTPTESFRASDPARIYISLVHDKFPHADQILIERLGEANWQRHVNIRRHIEESKQFSKQDAAEAPDGTVTGSRFQPPTLFHDSGIGTTLASQSHYTQSEASHTSFVSSLADREKGVARVPPTPVEIGLDEPFRCYLCGQMQSGIKNRVGWK